MYARTHTHTRTRTHTHTHTRARAHTHADTHTHTHTHTHIHTHTHRQAVLARLKSVGIDLEGAIEHEVVYTPSEWRRRYALFRSS